MAGFRQQLQIFIDAELSAASRAARFAAAAQEARDDLISTQQASSVYDTFVDGARGVPETQVDGEHGRILYNFGYVGLAAAFAVGFARARSPVRSGRFRDSFMLAVDGRMVPPASFNPASVPVGAEIYLFNTQPYARKVDVQISGRVRYNFSVPPGLIDDTGAATQRAYAGVVRARRIGSVTYPGQYVRVKNGAVVQTPALQIVAVT